MRDACVRQRQILRRFQEFITLKQKKYVSDFIAAFTFYRFMNFINQFRFQGTQ